MLLTRNQGRKGAAPVVVRPRHSLVHGLIVGAATLIGLFALYVVYELGRYNAGYDRQAVAQQRTELGVQIEHLERANRELRTRLAELDTIRVGRAREQAEVEHTIGDLQAQVARQSQELAFYRGVVAQGANSVGVKIEQLRISAGQRPGTYVVHMSLVRSGRAETLVGGTVHLTLDGAGSEGARTLELTTLTAGRQRELHYSFRYLQDFDAELAVPGSFKPERLNVEVRSARPEVPPLSQTFLWTVESSP